MYSWDQGLKICSLHFNRNEDGPSPLTERSEKNKEFLPPALVGIVTQSIIFLYVEKMTGNLLFQECDRLFLLLHAEEIMLD